jgi:protein disulfide-isomerase A6
VPDYFLVIELSTDLVRFYAPWCGHCKNLQPAYEQAAQKLKGLAKVAAIDCDDDANKPFCGSMGVQGFPTLKIVKPGKKPGRPIVEDYQGARTAKGIVDAVVEKIPNHVKRITDKTVDGYLKEDGAKAILFSDKGTTSALLKSLAIDYLGSVTVAQVRDKEKETVERFGIAKFPSFIVLPSGSEEPLVYDGELKKEPLSKFITESSNVSPNPDPAPQASKKSKPKKEKADKKAESKFSKASASHKAEEASSEKLKATSVSLEDEPTASPDPKIDSAKPVEVPDVAPALPVIESEAELHKHCLNEKAKVCILALLPKQADSDVLLPETASQALQSLSEIHQKLSGRGIFPFYAVSADIPLVDIIRSALSLKPSTDLDIIATNPKRNWARKYTGDTYGVQEIRDWIDAIKMNEGKKEKLPEILVQIPDENREAGDVPQPESDAEPEAEVVDEPKSPKVEEPDEPIAAPYIVTEGPIVIEITEEPEPEKNDIRDEL